MIAERNDFINAFASRIRANLATRCIISEAMHTRVQWKVHRRNVIIIVARFAYVWPGDGRSQNEEWAGWPERLNTGGGIKSGREKRRWHGERGSLRRKGVREWFYAGFTRRICMVIICGAHASTMQGWRGKRKGRVYDNEGGRDDGGDYWSREICIILRLNASVITLNSTTSNATGITVVYSRRWAYIASRLQNKMLITMRRWITRNPITLSPLSMYSISSIFFCKRKLSRFGEIGIEGADSRALKIYA